MKVSIITVTFNSEKTISETIKSVLAQSYKNIEYLIIDGRSSDNTINIIKEYIPSFNNRIKWISENDKGMYDAINKGIKMANGDIVGILNSDDIYREEHVIETIVNNFKADKSIECTIGDICFVKPENLARIVRYYSAKTWNPEKFRKGFMPPHPSFYTYKHNYEKFGFYKIDYKIAADYELLIRFLKVNHLKYKYVPLNMVTMRTGGKSTKNMKSNWILNKEIVRGCKENGIKTNMVILGLKYFKKVFELINIK